MTTTEAPVLDTAWHPDRQDRIAHSMAALAGEDCPACVQRRDMTKRPDYREEWRA